MAIEEEVTVEETGDDVIDEFLNAGVPEGIEDDPEPTEEQTTEEPTGGPTRDEQGRFTKKDEPAGGTAPVEGVAQPPVATDAAPPAEPEIPSQPFSFKVSGQEIAVDGAQYIPGEGLYIPDQHFETVRQLLSEGAYYKQNWRQLEQATENKGYQRALSSAPEIQQAKALSDTITQLFEDPEKLAEAYNNWATMGPMYREKAMREMAERRIAEMEKGTQQEQEERQTRELETVFDGEIQDAMSTLKSAPELKILTPDDWKMIDRQVSLLRQRGALFVQKDGEWYRDDPAIEEIALHVHSVRKQVMDAAKKAEEAAKFNAANKPKQAPAPVVTPRKGSAPKNPPAERDARDVVKDFLNAKLDDDD